MSSQLPPRDPGAPPWKIDQEQNRSRMMSDLQRQLDEAQAAIRRLTRELAKEQARHAETTEAYTKTVTNMVAVARENALLTHELERLKRAARPNMSIDLGGLPLDVTPTEAKVIRKAMARLHHPDVGGDEQRMKVWNAVLDQLDEAQA
jgi:hypothetical protein